MTLSELIEKAHDALKSHGDIEVVLHQDMDEYGFTGVESVKVSRLDMVNESLENTGSNDKFFCITDEIG